MIAAYAPMRATVRRKRLKAAQAVTERQAVDDVARLLDVRYKALCRELRRGNMRKRLSKLDSSSDLSKALNIDWAAWIKDFIKHLRAALIPIILAVQKVEAEYWATHGGKYDAGDPNDVIDGYEARTGQPLSAIGDTTQTGVLNTIRNWYSDPGQPFKSLLTKIGVFFSAARAADIVATESTNIASEVAGDAGPKMGATHWLWDLAPEDGPFPCQACVDKSEGGPYAFDDPTAKRPPIHPKDRCGMIYVNSAGVEV